MLMEPDHVRRKWTDCIKSLYSNTNRKQRPAIRKQMTGQSISKEEIRIAVKTMKKDKAVVNDKITFEMIQALENFGLDKITKIANHV